MYDNDPEILLQEEEDKKQPPIRYSDLLAVLRWNSPDFLSQNITIYVPSTGEYLQAAMKVSSTNDDVIGSNHLYLEIIE